MAGKRPFRACLRGIRLYWNSCLAVIKGNDVTTISLRQDNVAASAVIWVSWPAGHTKLYVKALV